MNHISLFFFPLSLGGPCKVLLLQNTWSLAASTAAGNSFFFCVFGLGKIREERKKKIIYLRKKPILTDISPFRHSIRALPASLLQPLCDTFGTPNTEELEKGTWLGNLWDESSILTSHTLLMEGDSARFESFGSD
jgi:hypothetical protein